MKYDSLIHVCLSHVQYGKQIITYRYDKFQQFRKVKNITINVVKSASVFHSGYRSFPKQTLARSIN